MRRARPRCDPEPSSVVRLLFINRRRLAASRRFAGEYRLDIVEFRQSGKRGEIVDVGGQYLVAYLSQHGVVELEKRQLHAAIAATAAA